MDVALATCRVLPEADPDQAPLLAALGAAGLAAGSLAWDDPEADFASARLTVLRSTWNYPQSPAAFLRWAEATAACSRLVNPLPAVRWNLNKGYLLDLERHGVPIVPTERVRRGSAARLDDICARRGWREVVVKPAISAASYRTLRVAAAGHGREPGAAHLAALLADGDALVQPYLESVEGHGERALVWIDGELTHAVRKTPRFAGEHEAVSPGAVAIAPAEAALAVRTLAALAAAIGRPGAAEELLYARIDMAPGSDGAPRLMELELIEPSLFFAQGPAALERMVRGLRRRLAADTGSDTG